MRSRLAVPLIVAGLLAASCSGGSDEADSTAAVAVETTASSDDTVAPDPTTPITDVVDTTTPSEPELAPAAFTPSPGTEQITVTGAEPGSELVLVDAGLQEAATGRVDDQGALLFRHLDGGATYTVRDETTTTEPVTTFDRGDHPDPAFFAEQRLEAPGFGYIITRDGTTLGATVWLPGPIEDGPYPTVVEYSGYEPSNPDSAGFSTLFTTLGYAYVGVNIRGTGCSGGSFRYFEYSQSLDGYDVVEAVAAQPWVLDNQVGMVGISYPGISQLFVAQTQPPNLVAITPLSVLDDSYNATLYPGGMLNTGFAVPWTEERLEQAQAEGQEWAAVRIADGDEECATNQLLRGQNPDLLAEIEANPFWSADTAAELAPRLFVGQIEVPTFVAGAWQDEQTGGHFATMLDQFTGTDHLYASLVNGLHTESIGPGVLPRLVEFLDLYVAKRTPSLDAARDVAPVLADGIFGTTDVSLPADRFTGMSYEEALAAFESEPPIQVLFEEGAADGTAARTPQPRWVESFDAWPIPEAETGIWYLDVDGALSADESTADVADTRYLAVPDGIPARFFDDSTGNIWSVDVAYDWQEPAPGTAATFITSPLGDDTVVIGSGSVDLYLQSNLGDTDLEVTISEVRPDGQEMYVQSGWLRASQRALDEDASTELRPVQTHFEADSAPLNDLDFELVRVELFPFAHAFRSGSRIRLSVDAPGGNRPVWVFDTITDGEEVTIAHDSVNPSRLVLPIVRGIDVPAAYPECGALRGQPCRAFAG